MNTTTAKTQMPSAGYGAALWRGLKSFGLLRESWVGMVGAFLVIFWVAVAILAPLIAPFDPNSSIQPFAKPGVAATKGGGTFWLGTDHIGRDIMSRIMWGSRTVLIYAPLATISAYLVGILMGLAAGYRGGWVDDILSRVADIILSFPVLVLYIIIIATIGASGINIIIAITFASSPGIMRIVRGLVLDLRNRDYVAAAQTRGESDWKVMLVEILPNARGPLIVDACLRLGYVIITIGVLGFLGLGLPPPDPDWGGMVNETRQMAMAFPHMTLFPCIAISSLILGFNLLADGLREISLRD
ncbi:Dipeptide transport system permease protein DppC (TC 3.A.1.5.2) [Olavius sp. associated proteobacterium Delta 1]|nr:Dipeptide transport system permease protein DppC (TC 3.A.1.5.2) [Olavius sp. associated proteobacterium Delta 1]